MALVSDIQLQDGSVKPPKLDTTQKFTVAGLTATTALAVGETVPLSTTGLVTVKSANDITNWIQTTNTNGNVSLYLSNDARPDWALKVAGTASDSFIIANSYGANNTEQYPAFSIGTAGAVGVGKTGAGNIIDVAYANSATGGIQLTETTNSVGVKLIGESTSGSIGTTTNHKMGFRVNGATQAAIDTSGQLGIGTDSPGAKLDVRGSATFNEGGAAVDFRVEGDTEANLLFVDGSADRVGIGTATPASLLHVDDGVGSNTVACFNGTINASCYAGEKEGHIIQCNFNNFAQRGGLSFNIDDVGTVTDCAGCDSTVVTINGANTCVCFFKCDGSNDDISLVGGSIGNALCNDTSPKLGGNLDVNNQCIINSNTDEGIRLVPNGAGRVIIDGLCWPASDGTAGYVLCTNGSGDLTWSPDGGSTWDVGSGVLFTNAGCKVGIGTSTPSDILTVFSCASTTNWGLNVCDPHPACAYGAQIKVTGACTGFPALSVVQNSDTLFRVDTGGVVGIGTSALGSTCNVKLDIYSAGASTAMILRSGNTSAASSAIVGEGYRVNGDSEQVLQIYGKNKNGGIDLGILEISAESKYCTGAIELKTFDGSSMTTKMKIRSDGNIGIGTADPISLSSQKSVTIFGSSVARLDMRNTSGNGGQVFATSSGVTLQGNTGAPVIVDGGSGCYVRFDIASSEQMRLTTTGLGIGTAAPTVPLEVYTAYSSGVANNIALRGTAGSKGEMRISFRATNVGSVDRVYARIGACVSCEVNGGAEAGNLTFKTWNGTAGEVTNMFLQSGGNVGIGTSSPDGTLHVHTASAGSVTAHGSADDLVVESSADAGLSILTPAANNGRIYFGSPTNNAYGQIDYDHATNDMVFATAGAGRLTIDSSGRVGISTPSPTSYNSVARNLVVASSGDGGMTIKSGTTSTGNIFFANAEASAANNGIIQYDHNTNEFAFNNYGSSQFYSFSIQGSEKLRLDATGLAIGTNSPLANHQLTIKGNYTTGFFRDYSDGSSNRSYILAIGAKRHSDGALIAGAQIYGDLEGNDTDGNLSIRTLSGGSTAERIRITSTGDFGIGTTAPAGRLVVMGDASSTQWALNVCDLNATCSYGARVFGKGSAAGYPLFMVNHNSDELLRVDTGGAVAMCGTVKIAPSGQNQVSTAQLNVAHDCDVVEGQTTNTKRGFGLAFNNKCAGAVAMRAEHRSGNPYDGSLVFYNQAYDGANYAWFESMVHFYTSDTVERLHGVVCGGCWFF